MIVVLIILIAIVFRSWFVIGQPLSSGDWPYLFLENIKNFSFLPDGKSLWLTPYYQITAKIFVEYLGFSWNLTEKILWFWPYLLISFFSSWYLARNIFNKSRFIFLTPLIFLLNTYSLMLVGGGQMGVALSYAMVPFVLGHFIKKIDSTKDIFFSTNWLRASFIMGLILAIQGMFDIRIAYITIGGVLIYFLVTQVLSRDNVNKIFTPFIFIFIIPGLVMILLHLYWILPLFFGHKNVIAEYDPIYNTVGAVRFFSFASFSQTLSLLHPNWPENIFGKIYFMMPEFIVLPILAYSSLFFLKSNKRKIIFFVLLGLIGSFLAKGMNEPFGEIYSFLFNYVPGFVMFRDPTKWYLFVILSYSVLIPFVLSQIVHLIKNNKKIIFPIVAIIFLLFWGFTIRFALLGQLGGTFTGHLLPKEYIQLKDFIKSRNNYSSTLWIPSTQRYGYSSKFHPSLSGQDFFNTSSLSAMLEQIDKLETRKKIREQKIKFIIVPYDLQKEIFITDRKYENGLYLKIKNKLKGLNWLKPVAEFKEISVFEVIIFL